MRALALALAGLALALAGCAGPRGAGTVYVVRHFDTPAGERDPDLTARGRSRAEALARWFADRRLSAIYVTPFKRTNQTAAPVAATKGITPRNYDWQQVDAFVAQIRAERGPVLVVGHSNTVPETVARLGGERPGPISHDDFGDLWIVRDGKTERVRID